MCGEWSWMENGRTARIGSPVSEDGGNRLRWGWGVWMEDVRT
jgi:hypothetical protein